MTFAPRATAKTKYCASCRRGENRVEADFLIQGRKHVDDTRTVPFKSYMCEEHVEAMVVDGDLVDYRVVETLSASARKNHAETLTRELTAYTGFNAMCKNNATLRTPPHSGRETHVKWRQLRFYFFSATGRQAFE